MGARAACLFAASESLLHAYHLASAQERPESTEQQLPRLRGVLGEAAFTAAWDRGQAMTMEQAIEYALQQRS